MERAGHTTVAPLLNDTKSTTPPTNDLEWHSLYDTSE